VHYWDPLVVYRIHGREILLPLSHNLPYNRKAWPLHNENLGRIAAYIAAVYSPLTVIDVGANVGDSLCVIGSAVPNFRALCIDADDVFFDLLVRNFGSDPDLVFEKCLVGDSATPVTGEMIRRGGTAMVVASTGRDQLDVTSLQTLLERHPLFLSAKLLKIDTDGYDCDVVDGSIHLLSRLKPVIFMEYDPEQMTHRGFDGTPTLQRLAGAGFRLGLVYDHVSDLMHSIDLGSATALEELNGYLRSSQARRYADICIFHDEDRELAELARREELRFFANYRLRVRGSRTDRTA
jgi:FkbM family methyltransferase